MFKILAVDDDNHILNLIRLTFQGEPYEVICLQDPAEVIPTVESTHVDAVILDVMLPAISGWELLEQLREHPKSRLVPVLMLSALTDPVDRARGIRSGADDFLSKPFHPEELLARVEALISRESRHLRGLHGRLEIQPVTELVQNFEHNTRSGLLEIITSQHSGMIELRRGKLVKAELGNLAGGEAVLAMLEVVEGSFRFTPTSIADDATWSEPLGALQPFLIEAAWLADELRRRGDRLPDPAVRLELLYLPADVPGELGGLPIVEVAGVFESQPGVTLSEVLDLHLGAPSKIKLAVAWLIEQRALRVSSSADAGT